MERYDVQKLANVAYVQSQIACSMADLEAMKAENVARENAGLALAYGEEHFMALIDKYQLGHNSVMTNLFSGL